MVKHTEEPNNLIPDFTTWAQCFTIYLEVLASHKPERVLDLLAYFFSIAAAAKKYKWQAWTIYGLNFRQQAADNPEQLWARVDPSIYSQCYLGMGKATESWCRVCHSLDHASVASPEQSNHLHTYFLCSRILTAGSRVHLLCWLSPGSETILFSHIVAVEVSISTPYSIYTHPSFFCLNCV